MEKEGVAAVNMRQRDAKWQLYGHKVVDKSAGVMGIVYPPPLEQIGTNTIKNERLI